MSRRLSWLWRVLGQIGVFAAQGAVCANCSAINRYPVAVGDPCRFCGGRVLK